MRSRLLRRATVNIVLGMLASAAQAGSVDVPLQTGGAYSVKVQSLKERRFATTERQQHDFSCGSAALATLLSHHYSTPVGESAVFDEMLARGDAAAIQRDGFSLLDMKRYLAEHGFSADGFEAPVERLAEAGVPAIALVNERGYNHFVVIKGLRGQRVLIGDPAGGTRALPLARFQAMRADDLLFVIADRLELAHFNRDADWAVVPPAPLTERTGGGANWATQSRLGKSDF